jgi:hypothetical protein
MKYLRSALIGALVAASTVSVAMADSQAPLAPGKPAGIHEANLRGNGWVVIVGLGAVIAATAIILSSGDKNHPTTPTTTATGTSLP